MNLYEERKSILEETRKVLDTAETEKRGLTAEENESIDKRDARVGEIDGILQRKDKLTEANKIVEQIVERKLPANGKAERAESGISEFRRYLRTGELRAFSEGTNSAGGYTVFPDKTPELGTLLQPSSVVRPWATVIPTSSSSLVMPSVGVVSNTAIKTEGSGAAAGAATFTNPTVNIYTYGVYVDTSNELINDSQYDIEKEILNQAILSFDELENNYLVVGTGSSQPEGIVTGSGLGVTAAATNAITGDEIFGLIYSMIEQYRVGGRFFANDSTQLAIRKLKDSSGRYLWEPALAAGQPATLAGYPIHSANHMAQLSDGAGSKVLLFANCRDYVIGENQGLTVVRDPYTVSINYQTRFSIFKRFGGKVRVNNGIKYLITAAS